MSNSEKEPAPLSAALMSYRAAQEQEFALAKTATTEDLAEKGRESLYGLIGQSQKVLMEILISGDSDSVRLQAAKLVFAYTLGDPKTAGNEDDLSKLLNKLQKPVAT